MYYFIFHIFNEFLIYLQLARLVKMNLKAHVIVTERIVERQILGVIIRTHFIHMLHAHCIRLDAAFRKHDALV